MKRDTSAFGMIAVGWLAFELGLLAGHADHIDNASHETKIEHIQAYNTEVHDQLDGSYPGLSHMTLRDREKSFSFEVTNAAGEKLTCRGEYEVTNETAHAVGDIACTSTQKVSR